MKSISLLLCLSVLVGAASTQGGIDTKGDWGHTTFYGSIRVLLTDEDGRQKDIADGISRIGIKGAMNFTDSWQGTYRLEGRVIADSGILFSDGSDIHKRVTYIGVKNKDFGEVRLGKQLSPHYLWTILPIDITLHNPRHYNIRWNASENSSIREANSIAYFSPNYFGVSVAALAEIDGSDDESDSVDSYNVAIRYKAGPWQVGASFFDRSDNSRINGAFRPDADTLATTVQYKSGGHKAVVRYQDEDIEGNAEFTTIGAYYSYRFGDNQGYELQSRIYNLDNGVIDGNQTAIGFTRKFKKFGQLFIEYVDYDEEAEILKGRKNDLTLGLRVDF